MLVEKYIENSLLKILARKNIGLHEPKFNNKDLENVKKCVKSTFVSSAGKFIDQFEKKLKKITGSKFVIATNSGTSALHIALKVVGVQENSCVIVSPLSFVASVNAIRYNNSDPIFLDCEKDNFSLSPSILKDFLINQTYRKKEGVFFKKNRKKISAILVPHVFGASAKIDELIKISKNYKIPVVEDSAESLGCYYNKTHLGTHGNIGVLSFNGNKIVTTGSGGAILTNSKKLYKECLHLVKVAKKKHLWEFNHDRVGYNYRISNLSSSLGCAQLDRFNLTLIKKKLLHEKYKKYFQNNKYFTFIDFDQIDNLASNYWLNGIVLNKKYKKEKILNYLNKKGFYCRPAWKILCDLKPFKKFHKYKIKNAYELEKQLIFLPSSPDLV
tara:strand:+ start:25299 stop:26453 length:1155 start_codon:yes stop_codon:yes gene_type:complete